MEKFKEKRKIQNWKIKKWKIKSSESKSKPFHLPSEKNWFFLKWWKMIVMVADADGTFGVGVGVVQWI